MESSRLTSICVGCGLCCDGTMYGTVDVAEGDQVGLLTTAGLGVVVEGGTSRFRQPCRAFGGGCCAVYEGRPSVCRTYRCLLLRRHEAEELSVHEARAVIDRATAFRDRVRSGLSAFVEPEGPLPLAALYRLMLARLDAMPDAASARRENAEILLDVAALRVILARDFEPRDSKSHQPDEADKAHAR